MNKKQILCIALLACSSSYIMSKTLLLGDLPQSDQYNQGFSFDLLKKLAKGSEYIYAASATDLSNESEEVKKHALTVAKATSKKCVAIATKNATVNGQKDQANPLHGAQFSALYSTNGHPILIKQDDASILYLVTSSPHALQPTIITNTTAQDAEQGTGEFLTYDDCDNQDAIVGNGSLIFAAIKPKNGDFGSDSLTTTHSGIGIFKNTPTGLVQQKAVPGNDTVRSVAISVATPIFRISNPLKEIKANHVNLYWDNELQRLFIGVQSTSGAENNDGCKSVAVGLTRTAHDNTTLEFYNICSDSVITGYMKVIGAKGAGTKAFVHKQAILHSSFGPSYLIVVGESVGPENNNPYQKNCYCLPLVDESVDPTKSATWRTSLTHATLADVTSAPEVYYKNSNGKSVFAGRAFATPATQTDDLYNKDNAAALVGKGSIEDLGAGVIKDVITYKDTVFVLVSGGNTQRPGVFYSQAIFDKNYAIANWTQWQRLTYTTHDVVNDFNYIPSTGAILQLEGVHNDTRSVTVSNWSQAQKDNLLGGTLEDESVGLAALLEQEFPQEQGGIFGLFDFQNDFATTFFSHDQTPGTAMMIATGYKKVGLILTYSSNKVGEAPVTGDFKNDTSYFTEGKIDTTPKDTTKALFVSGGVLDDLEAITSATLITNMTNNLRYVVVGGSSGVAVLRNPNNQEGFGNPLKAGFAQLGQNLQFELLGDFKNVKKLWTAVLGEPNNQQKQYLFILTHEGLYRVDVLELKKDWHDDDDNKAPAIVQLASYDTIESLQLTENDFFTDVIVSNKLCLLGTNKGLLRNNNATTIIEAADAQDCRWEKVNLTEPYTYVQQLLPLYTSPVPYEFATQGDGQVYVLTHSQDFKTSVIQCLSVKDISNSAISDETCTLLTQEIIKDKPLPYIFLNSLRNSHFTTGAATFTVSYGSIKNSAQLLKTPIKSMFTTGIKELLPAQEVKIDLPVATNRPTILNGIVQHSALGSLITYGDFGIRVYS